MTECNACKDFDKHFTQRVSERLDFDPDYPHQQETKTVLKEIRFNALEALGSTFECDKNKLTCLPLKRLANNEK